MPRATWTGAIQFGLVTIPVRLERATIPHDIHFHLVHGKDGGRIHHKRICSIDGQEVPFEEVVKGYELNDGEQVEVTPEEIALLDTYGPRTITIEDFVEGQEIDPLYFERTYYVVPESDPDAQKAFELLRTAMFNSGRLAIARITMRLREHLCALSISRGLLLLSMLRYATEITSPPDVELAPTTAPDDRDVAMAEQLIDAMTTRFRPDHYRDEYREHVISLLRQKASDASFSLAQASEPSATRNLTESLAASLKQSNEWSRGGRPSGIGASSTKERSLPTTPSEGEPVRH